MGLGGRAGTEVNQGGVKGTLAGLQLGGWARACPCVGCQASTRGAFAAGACKGSMLGNELGNDQMQKGIPAPHPSLWTEHLCCGDHVLRGCGLWSSASPAESPTAVRRLGTQGLRL